MSVRATTLEMRLLPEDKELLRHAAGLRRQTLTDFILSSMLPVARAVVEDECRIELSRDAWLRFVEICESDVQPGELAQREAAAFLADMRAGRSATRGGHG